MKIYKYERKRYDLTGEDTTKGFKAECYLKSNGAEETSSTGLWSITEYQEIPSNESTLNITTNRNTNAAICFYDNSKTYISGTAYQNIPAQAVIIPAGAAYFRMSVHKDDMSDFSAELPTKWREAKGYQYTHGENLFDAATNNVTTGKYIDSNGGILNSAPSYVGSDTYNYTDYIPVEAGKTYTRTWHGPAFLTNHGMSVAWYNSSKVFLSRTDGATGPIGTTDIVDNFTAPENAAYARVNFSSKTWPNSNVTMQFYETEVEWREAAAHKYSSGSWD